MTRLLILLLAPTFLVACASQDEPSSYAASAPAAAPASSDADARLAEAEARAAEAEARLAEAQGQGSSAAAPRPSGSSQSRGGSYSVGTAPGNYAGGVDASGLRQFCETYDRTSVARFRGLKVCYAVRMQQHRDGSLQGTGYKSLEVMPGTDGRDLEPGEQSQIRLTGYIDNSDTIHLEYTVQGARRATKGVATFDGGRTVLNSAWGSEDFPGTFRSDAANASGSATISSDALID